MDAGATLRGAAPLLAEPRLCPLFCGKHRHCVNDKQEHCLRSEIKASGFGPAAI